MSSTIDGFSPKKSKSKVRSLLNPITPILYSSSLDFLSNLEFKRGASFLISEPIIRHPSESSIPLKVELKSHLSGGPEILEPSCLQSKLSLPMFFINFLRA